MKTFGDIIAGVILLFVVIIILSIGILRAFKIKKYAISLATAHSIFIITFSSIYYSAPDHDAMADMVWGIPFVMDLPFSLLGIILGIKGAYAIPVSLFIFGTLQYWLLGYFLDKFLRKKSLSENERTTETHAVESKTTSSESD